MSAGARRPWICFPTPASQTSIDAVHRRRDLVDPSWQHAQDTKHRPRRFLRAGPLRLDEGALAGEPRPALPMTPDGDGIVHALHRWRILLFSRRGRISRRTFLIAFWCNAFASATISVAASRISVALFRTEWDGIHAITVIPVSAVIGFVLNVKRAHDLGHSSAWLLLPWGLIQLHFLHGMSGGNQYGPDPLRQSKDPGAGPDMVPSASDRGPEECAPHSVG